MANSRSVREIRVTVQAGLVTPVYPPASGFRRCLIGNGSGADVQLHTHENLLEYRVITNGFERELRVANPFRTEEIAFWLLSTPGGLVIVEWS